MAKPFVPTGERAAAKWVRRAAGASQDYADGVRTTGKSWQAAATAASPLWQQAVTDPKAKGRFEKNVARAGDTEWKRGVEEKGAARYPSGVSASERKYGERIAPVLSAIAAVEIPNRGLPASDQNFQRSRLIGQALNRLRVGTTA